MSLGSILTNIFVQLIILLYLLDNNEETSWMILASQGVGLLIEAWKITKAVAVNILPAPAGSMLPYRIQVINKHVLSTEEQKTQEYDRLAFKYVSWIAGPLLCAYTIYSAIYETHRGWWSFVIGTLTSFVYAFGFVSLIPQLIVNYKLKSVAHINTKAFVCKSKFALVLPVCLGTEIEFCLPRPQTRSWVLSSTTFSHSASRCRCKSSGPNRSTHSVILTLRIVSGLLSPLFSPISSRDSQIAPSGLFPRRRSLLRVHLPMVDLPDRQEPSERVRTSLGARSGRACHRGRCDRRKQGG